jgi:hypothetical protein
VVESLLTVAVLAFIGSRLVVGARLSLRPDMRSRTAEILRGVRLRHVLLAPVVLTVIIIVASVLIELPVLEWGWWSAIGGEGNPVIGVTEQTSHSPLEWILPAAFLLLLLPALPLFAEREERMFRLGAEHWSFWRRVARGVQFGLVHALIGIPLGAALTLSVGGWYFTAMYLRGYRRSGGDGRAGLLESTRAHAVYNLEILALVAVALSIGV